MKRINYCVYYILNSFVLYFRLMLKNSAKSSNCVRLKAQLKSSKRFSLRS